MIGGRLFNDRFFRDHFTRGRIDDRRIINLCLVAGQLCRGQLAIIIQLGAFLFQRRLLYKTLAVYSNKSHGGRLQSGRIIGLPRRSDAAIFAYASTEDVVTSIASPRKGISSEGAPLRVLLIGGTGLISTGIIKHLQARGGCEITMFNRAQRESTLAGDVKQITGDRTDFAAFENRFAAERFDVVIDMICFTPKQAESDVRRLRQPLPGHFIFCSTVCTYGTKIPGTVLVDETFPQEPISDYGRNKLECERIFLRAHEKGEWPRHHHPPQQHLWSRRAIDRQSGIQSCRVGPHRARLAGALQRRRTGAVGFDPSR